MKASRAAALLAVPVICSSCGLSLQSLPKLGGVSGPTYTLTADFANVVNLPANAQVMVGAFSVGNVTSIGLHGFQAVVTMRIKDSTHLPVGTTASIRFATPLGDDFVLLQPPSNAVPGTAELRGGAVIPESETTTAPSVEDTFGALGALLNGGGINQLQTIIGQTNLALSGNQSHIRALISDLDSTVTSLAQNAPSIDGALQAMAALTRTLNQGSASIRDGIAALGPASDVLAGETGNFQQLFVELDKLGSAANAIVSQSSSGTVATVRQMQPLLDQLVGVESQLGPALNAITALEHYTPRAVPGSYLQLAVNADIGVPPVPSDAPPLDKITVDPPDPSQAYNAAAVATLIEGGLP